MTEKYDYQGKQFDVSKPEDCDMTVSGMGLTATISVNKTTNQYGVGLDGLGWRFDNLPEAVNHACERILHKSSRPPSKQLCAEMDEFYNSLGKQ